MLGSLSGKLASMGSGVPYAIAAKMAHPQRPVIAMVGDGAMQMNGNAELLTVKQYWKRWQDPRFIVMRSEEHTSELQSLMRISYAVFCLTKKKLNTKIKR